MAEPMNLRPSWLIAIAVIAVLVAGVGGFYLGEAQNQQASSPALTRQAARALPPGVVRLPLQHFSHWNLSCLQNAQGHKSCQLALRAIDRQSHALVFSMALAHNLKGAPVLAIVTPPNALISSGVQIAPASGSAGFKFAFTTCGPGACQAVAPLSDEIISAFGSNESVRVAYTAGNGRQVSYNLPVAGFSDGYAAWKD